MWGFVCVCVCVVCVVFVCVVCVCCVCCVCVCVCVLSSVFELLCFVVSASAGLHVRISPGCDGEDRFAG